MFYFIQTRFTLVRARTVISVRFAINRMADVVEIHGGNDFEDDVEGDRKQYAFPSYLLIMIMHYNIFATSYKVVLFA